jgi:hypothetical protein
MLREAIDSMVHLIRSADKVVVGHLDVRRVIISQGGQHEIQDMEAPVRCHHVATVGDLVGAACHWCGMMEDPPSPQNGVLWHDKDRAQLILDDGDRWDRVVLPLVFSDFFEGLQSLGNMDQHQFIRFLKAMENHLDDNLLPRVRKLVVTNDQSREVTPMRERGTQEFKTELADGEGLPEYVMIACPVYQTFPCVQQIRFSLDIDVRNLTFTLAALPDEFKNAVDGAQLHLAQLLRSGSPEGMPVFYGNPGENRIPQV